MLVRDIINESRMGEMEGDLDGLLMAVRANNVSDIDSDKIVSQMQKMGYSVDAASLVDLLQDNPLIQTATIDNIQFKHANPYAVSGDEESKVKNQEKVKSLAKKAAAKGIKK